MEDLVKITSLLVLDGGKYYYLHKTIPEYFAAQKISEEKNPDNKCRFYEQMRTNVIPENWYQSLLFLNEIDDYSFTKELLLPYYYKTFGVSEDDIPLNAPLFTKEQIIEIVGERATLEIRFTGRQEDYAVNLRLDSGNWLAHARLNAALQQTVKEYVNGLSILQLSRLLDRNRESAFFVDCLDYTTGWPAFLTYVNGQSPLRAMYSNILVLKRKLDRQEKKGRPLFELRLGK